MRWRGKAGAVGASPIGQAAGQMGLGDEFGRMELGRLTWIGLGVAAIGWALILAETSVSAVLFARSGRAAPAAFHADLFEIGKCVIMSGFGLAVVGALQAGFGTLNRFFAAVLMRSGRRESAPAPAPAPVERPAERSRERTTERPAPRPTPIERRPYRMFPDGSVEVDTILGSRRFATMAEAREFI